MELQSIIFFWSIQRTIRNRILFTCDNTAIAWRFIKANKDVSIHETNTSHLKFFYTHKLQKSGDIDVKQILSCDNLVDMFTKPLPTMTFKKMVHNIGIHQLKDIFIMNNGNSMYLWGGVNFLNDVCWLYSFSLAKFFFPTRFLFGKVLTRHILRKWSSKGEC